MITFVRLCPEDRKIIEEIGQMEMEIFPDPWSVSEIRSTVKQSHSFCVAAMEEKEVIGYFLCYYVLDECELARIAVRKERRREGVGQRLFDEMDRICQEKQLTTILLDVRKSNEAAIGFYEKNGFSVDGERKLYYGGKNPEDALLMSRRCSE